MPRGGARPNSGRGTILDDIKLAEILNISSGIALRFMRDESIPIEKRVEVASRFIAKRIPQDINLGGQKENPLNFIVEELHKKSNEYKSSFVGGVHDP